MITTLSAIRALREHRARSRTSHVQSARSPRIKSDRRQLIDIPQLAAVTSLLFGIIIFVLLGSPSPSPAMDPIGSFGRSWSPTQPYID